eukprot:scaffold19123_cov73-Isochrysis_galbana.AAC.1
MKQAMRVTAARCQTRSLRKMGNVKKAMPGEKGGMGVEGRRVGGRCAGWFGVRGGFDLWCAVHGVSLNGRGVKTTGPV